MTIFSLVSFPCLVMAQIMTVDARVEYERAVANNIPQTVKCNVHFTGAPLQESGKWRIERLSGVWNEDRISAENYIFELKSNKKTPLDRALKMLIPYAMEDLKKIPVPKESGPLNREYMYELLRKQGLEPEGLQKLAGQWEIDTSQAVLTIKGHSKEQHIDYAMILTDDSREIRFDFKATAKFTENDPWTLGLETLVHSGKGAVKVSGYKALQPKTE